MPALFMVFGPGGNNPPSLFSIITYLPLGCAKKRRFLTRNVEQLHRLCPA
jgi:hypothetical protein